MSDANPATSAPDLPPLPSWAIDSGLAERIQSYARLAVEQARAAYAAPVEAKPVAWVIEDHRVGSDMRPIPGETHTVDYDQPAIEALSIGTKLYAAPVAATEGWQLVPKEPTPEMVRATFQLDLTYMLTEWGPDREAIYKAMLAAAPIPAPTPTDAGQEATTDQLGEAWVYGWDEAIERAAELIESQLPALDPSQHWFVGAIRRMKRTQAGGVVSTRRHACGD